MNARSCVTRELPTERSLGSMACVHASLNQLHSESKAGRMARYQEKLETGDHVFRDSTEAIRSKYSQSHTGRRFLTKCPFCHQDFRSKDAEQHRLTCPKKPKRNPLGRPSWLSKALTRAFNATRARETKGRAELESSTKKKAKKAQTVVCFKCRIRFSKTAHVKHMRQVHGMITCKLCGAIVRPQNLKTHIDKMHTSAPCKRDPKPI